MPSRLTLLLLTILVAVPTAVAQVGAPGSASISADPPFSGTIFLDPDIITSADPTTFESLIYAGRGVRTMYDRRLNAFASFNAYLYSARYTDFPGRTVEIQVNPEMGSEPAARVWADQYAPVIGRIPTAFRTRLETVWIHLGNQPFGGGNRNLLIHTAQGASYISSGILEETFIHEASHTSLDEFHATAPGWIAAQQADREFISTYARDNPTREDVAESSLPWLAVTYRPDRISSQLAQTIRSTMPNRIAYFNAAGFNMHPITASGTATEPADELPSLGLWLDPAYPNPFSNEMTVSFEAEGTVRLTVIDLLGRTVATLVNDSSSAGIRRVTWRGLDGDGARLPDGVYLLRLARGDAAVSRPVVLSK